MAEAGKSGELAVPEERVIAEPELPRAHVLNYVTLADTPTRVRRIAFVATRALGMMFGPAGVILICRDAYRLTTSAIRFGAPPGAPPVPVSRIIIDVMFYYVARRPPNFMFAAALSVVGLSFLLLAGAVKRGNRSASIGVFWCVVLMIGVLVVVTAWLFSYGLSEGLRLSRPAIGPEALWLVALSLVGVLGVMVLIDLAGFLRWIARNPVTEKQARAFLPSGLRKEGKATREDGPHV